MGARRSPRVKADTRMLVSKNALPPLICLGAVKLVSGGQRTSELAYPLERVLFTAIARNGSSSHKLQGKLNPLRQRQFPRPVNRIGLPPHIDLPCIAT